MDELNVTGKECTGVDFTGGGKCDGTIKFEGENTYGKPARRRPNFVLRIRPSEDDKKEKQFARPEHVDQILNYLEKKDEEKPESPAEQLGEHPTRKIRFIERSTLPETTTATCWYVEFNGPYDNNNPKHGRQPHVMIQKGHRVPEIGKIYELVALQQWGGAVSYTHLTLPTILLV